MSVRVFFCLLALAQTTSCLWFDARASSYAKYEDWTTPHLGELVFYFKTNKPNGLLLYKDEKNFEFLDVSLVDGRARLRLAMYKCSSQRAFVESYFVDSKWHRVRIAFNNEKTTITVDETWSASVNCSNNAPHGFTQLTGAMYLGGLPKGIDLQSLAFPSSYYEFYEEKRFNGCISGLRYTEEDGGTFRKAKLNTTRGTESGCTDPCSKCGRNGKCIYQQKTFRCNCGGTGYEEPFCRQASPSVEMNGSNYILYNLTKDVQHLSFMSSYVAVRVQTVDSDGLVLQTSLRHKNQKDFFMVELHNGSILVKMDLGKGEIMLTGGHGSLLDGNWHWIEVQRHRHTVSLIIDDEVTSSRKIPGKFTRLDFYKGKAQMYIGGGPEEQLTKSVSKRNFSGFLQQFRFGKIKVLVRALSDNHSQDFTNFGAVIRAILPTTATQLVTTPMSSTEGSGCIYEDDEDLCVSTSESTSVPSTQSTQPQSLTLNTTATSDQSAQQSPSESRNFPIWLISLFVIIMAAAAVLVTVVLVFRWHTRYTGSFKPERTRQSTEVNSETGKVPLSVTKKIIKV